MSVEQVWEAYRRRHPHAVLSPERRALIKRRLDQGWPVEILIDAIDGNHLDPHCNGENDRTKQYHGLALILRDADHIERYAALAEQERPVDQVAAARDQYDRWASAQGEEHAVEMLHGTYPDHIVAEVLSWRGESGGEQA